MSLDTMNVAEITKDKLRPLIQKGLLEIVEVVENNLYEYVVLTADASGFNIMVDKRENTTDIIFFIKNEGEIPSILDQSHRVNIIFYLEIKEIFEQDDHIKEFVNLHCDTYTIIEKFSEILSLNIDEFLNPNIDAFKLAIKNSDDYLVENMRQFEIQMRDEGD